MERITKSDLVSQLHNKQFLITFVDYEHYKQLRSGYISNATVSLFDDVYNIDDVFVDNPYLFLIKKTILSTGMFQEVRLVDNPKSIFEKNDNDLVEWKATITHMDVEPEFYYIREM